MTELLEPHVGRAKARMIVALLDGVMLHALVTATPLDPAPLTAALRALIPVDNPAKMSDPAD
jgi:DNA-binding transcriptional regulator YbjK